MHERKQARQENTQVQVLLLFLPLPPPYFNVDGSSATNFNNQIYQK